MSEAQQGPEICDVISAKRNYFLFYFNSRSLCGGERSVWFGQEFLIYIYYNIYLYYFPQKVCNFHM